MIDIDWASLFKVAGVSLVFGVGIVAVFSVGLVGLSMGESLDGQGQVDGEGAAAKPAGTVLAGLCFLICAAAVAFGIWLIVPQFH